MIVRTVSTDKEHRSAAATSESSTGRVALARRRIAEGFYDRLEVRKTIAALVLIKLTSPKRSGSAHHETA